MKKTCATRRPTTTTSATIRLACACSTSSGSLNSRQNLRTMPIAAMPAAATTTTVCFGTLQSRGNACADVAYSRFRPTTSSTKTRPTTPPLKPTDAPNEPTTDSTTSSVSPSLTALNRKAIEPCSARQPTVRRAAGDTRKRVLKLHI